MDAVFGCFRSVSKPKIPIDFWCGTGSNKHRADHFRPARSHLNIYPFDAGRSAAALSSFDSAETMGRTSSSVQEIEIVRPKEWCAPGESETLTTYSLVSICATLDGVDMKFEACVVLDIFPL